MLLFDTGKKLEKAFTSEQFAVLVEVLENREDKAASKNDLRETELRLQATIEKLSNEIRQTGLRLQKELQQAKYFLIKWQIGIAFVMILFLAKGFGWLGF